MRPGVGVRGVYRHTGQHARCNRPGTIRLVRCERWRRWRWSHLTGALGHSTRCQKLHLLWAPTEPHPLRAKPLGAAVEMEHRSGLVTC